MTCLIPLTQSRDQEGTIEYDPGSQKYFNSSISEHSVITFYLMDITSPLLLFGRYLQAPPPEPLPHPRPADTSSQLGKIASIIVILAPYFNSIQPHAPRSTVGQLLSYQFCFQKVIDYRSFHHYNCP